jgi:hypothetical protein
VTTRSQADATKNVFPFMMGGHRIGSIKLLYDEEDDPMMRTLAGKMFGDRLRKVEFGACAVSKLLHFRAPTEIEESGFRLELICSKIHSEKAKYGRLARPVLYYFLTSGPGLEQINLQDSLSKVADFESVGDAGKTASRIELLFSPAMSEKKEAVIIELSENEFEFVEDTTELAKCSEGNFHAPRSFFENCFKGVRGQRITTVQPRFLIDGRLGKGTFTLKEGIDKIQIPRSMIKVDASKVAVNNRRNFILVTKAFPSKKNLYMGKYLNKEVVRATALDELQQPISNMFRDVLIDKGVPKHLITEYNTRKVKGKKERDKRKSIKTRQSKRIKNQKQQNREAPPQDDLYFADAYLVGGCDPTPGCRIPNGYVAIPGLPDSVDSVLVSRSPALSQADMARLPVWKNSILNHHHFGEMFFGNGSTPLPNLLADGDLDGDLYFVIWDEKIVEEVPFTDIAALEQTVILSRKRSKKHSRFFSRTTKVENNNNWFKETQDVMADVGLAIQVTALISILYNESKAEWSSDNCVRDDYIAYGNAYKKSLDLQKHGDAVDLPGHLWEPFDKLEYLHKFLVKTSLTPKE